MTEVVTPSALQDAYRHTTYIADTPARLRIRIGERHSALDALLAGEGNTLVGVRDGFQPRNGATHGRAESQEAAEARGGARGSGVSLFRGEGVADDGRWMEPSVLVLGILRLAGVEIGRRYRQAAIVYGEEGEPAELLALE